MKRLGIYFFFDKDGVVDDYVPYFLKNLKPFLQELCVVVNAPLNDEGKRKLSKFADKFIVRENEGFDSWAYKEAIESYGYEKLAQYDEVILSNYTFFGPLYPMHEMFDKMDTTSCDFWGIHRHPEIPFQMANTDVIEHIQSHFIAFRKTILQSPDFKTYWQTLQKINSYEEAVACHELRCTKYFEDLGYISETYLNNKKYFALFNGNASVHYAYQQTVEDRCPILKRKFLWIDNKCIKWSQLTPENAVDLICYIKNNTDYPIELIRDNVYRVQNIDEIKFPLRNKIKYWKYKLLRWIALWKFERYTKRMNVMKRSNFITAEQIKKAFGKEDVE